MMNSLSGTKKVVDSSVFSGHCEASSFSVEDFTLNQASWQSLGRCKEKKMARSGII